MTVPEVLHILVVVLLLLGYLTVTWILFFVSSDRGLVQSVLCHASPFQAACPFDSTSFVAKYRKGQ